MNPDLAILYEDNHIIAVNKKQHDLVQKDITGDLALDDKLKAYIRDCVTSLRTTRRGTNW